MGGNFVPVLKVYFFSFTLLSDLKYNLRSCRLSISIVMELNQIYVSPETVVIEVFPEGVLCNSNEPVFDTDGRW